MTSVRHLLLDDWYVEPELGKGRGVNLVALVELESIGFGKSQVRIDDHLVDANNPNEATVPKPGLHGCAGYPFKREYQNEEHCGHSRYARQQLAFQLSRSWFTRRDRLVAKHVWSMHLVFHPHFHMTHP